jgi:peptidoglycan/xylan/chitin deacetylase (PgdA/CDA1 family)
MAHPWLPFVSNARIQCELAGCNAALEGTLGRKVELFRPPHGALRPAVFRAARSLQLETVQWNLIVDDWSAASAEVILARLTAGIARNRRRRRGTNVVLHDGGQNGLGQPRLKTVQAVARLLEQVAPDTQFVAPQAGGWI